MSLSPFPLVDESYDDGLDGFNGNLAETVRRALDRGRHYLPTQGPISVFIHHNTLHAFESLPFEQAVLEGLKTYGAQPYWPESRYHDELAKGRIRKQDIQAVLEKDLGSDGSLRIGGEVTRYDLRLSMLLETVLTGSDAELRWLFAQSDALEQFRSGVDPAVQTLLIESTRHWVLRNLRPHLANGTSVPPIVRKVLDRFTIHNIDRWSETEWRQLTLQLLWKFCQEGAHHPYAASPVPPQVQRHRDVLLKLAHHDCDELVHAFLIRFTASFLDQGFAAWTLDHREQGFYQCFLNLFSDQSLWSEAWLRR